MRTPSLFGVVVVVVACFAAASPAAAQSTRTWVASAGDDVNPCSSTAPCKTFAGALAKTAPGGEVNCLTPGGYGALSITKSVTIDCTGTFGGILSGGLNGVIINAGANDVVRLRGLSINGNGSGVSGVRFVGGGALFIDRCTIENVKTSNGFGVDFSPAGIATLVVTDTSISGNGANATGGGVRVRTATAGSNAVFDRVRVVDNVGEGMRLDGTGLAVTVRDSLISENDTGIVAFVSTVVVVDDVAVVKNRGTGIAMQGGSIGRVNRSTISFNGTGVNATGTAQLKSFGTNILLGNGADGAFAPGVLDLN